MRLRRTDSGGPGTDEQMGQDWHTHMCMVGGSALSLDNLMRRHVVRIVYMLCGCSSACAWLPPHIQCEKAADNDAKWFGSRSVQ